MASNCCSKEPDPSIIEVLNKENNMIETNKITKLLNLKKN